MLCCATLDTHSRAFTVRVETFHSNAGSPRRRLCVSAPSLLLFLADSLPSPKPCSVYIKHTPDSAITKVAWTHRVLPEQISSAQGSLRGRQQWPADELRELQNGLKRVGISKTALWTEIGIPAKDKEGEKWMKRAAKGLCFILKYKAVPEIMQYIDYVSLTGKKLLLTRLNVVFVGYICLGLMQLL